MRARLTNLDLIVMTGVLVVVAAGSGACSKKVDKPEQKPQTAASEESDKRIREVPPTAPAPTESVEKATASPKESESEESKWVTTQVEKFDDKGGRASLETRVFGPDGSERRWVTLSQGRRANLAEGEWAIVSEKKYVGRAGGGEIWLAGSSIKTHNVDVFVRGK